MAKQKVTTFLWFNEKAEEAAALYVTLFPDSKVDRITPGPGGGPWVVEFTLAGVQYIALNGGPHFQLNEAVSLSIDCADQAEVDRCWAALSDGGTPLQCGWLKDRWGLCWQVVPSGVSRMMTDPDPEKAARATAAVMGMIKLDLAAITKAYEGK